MQVELGGLLDDDGLRANVDLIDLDGEMRGQALRGAGKVAVNGDDLAIDGVEVNYGGARLVAGGGIRGEWDLHWELSAPRLQQTLPEASGTLRGRGTIIGERARPHITAHLHGSGLSYQEQQIRSLALDADVDLSESQSSRIELALGEISLNGRPLQRVNLRATGKPSKQQIEMQIEMPTDELSVQVRGAMGPDRWQGRLEQVNLVGRGYGAWTLEEPAELGLRPGRIAMAGKLSDRPPARLCLGASSSTVEGLQASLRATDVPLERFAGLMPPGVFVRSRVNAEIAGGTSATGELHGTADLNLTAGNVELALDSGTLTIPLERGSVRAEAKEDELHGR